MHLRFMGNIKTSPFRLMMEGGVFESLSAVIKYEARFKSIHMGSGFFILTKLNGGRRSSATLTAVKQSQGGKDALR